MSIFTTNRQPTSTDRNWPERKPEPPCCVTSQHSAAQAQAHCDRLHAEYSSDMPIPIAQAAQAQRYARAVGNQASAAEQEDIKYQIWLDTAGGDK